MFVDENLVCDHSNENYQAVLSCGTVCFKVVWHFRTFVVITEVVFLQAATSANLYHYDPFQWVMLIAILANKIFWISLLHDQLITGIGEICQYNHVTVV